MAAQEAVDAIFRAAREGDVGEVVRLLDAQPDLLEANHPCVSGRCYMRLPVVGRRR